MAAGRGLIHLILFSVVVSCACYEVQVCTTDTPCDIGEEKKVYSFGGFLNADCDPNSGGNDSQGIDYACLNSSQKYRLADNIIAVAGDGNGKLLPQNLVCFSFKGFRCTRGVHCRPQRLLCQAMPEEPPILHEALYETRIHMVKLGEQFNLTCDVRNAFDVYWSFNTKNSTKKVSTSRTLKIYGVNFKHQGSYECVATGLTRVRSQPQILIIEDYMKFTVILNDTIEPTDINKTINALKERKFEVDEVDDSPEFLEVYIEQEPGAAINSSILEELRLILEKCINGSFAEILTNSYCQSDRLTTSYGTLEFEDTFVDGVADSTQRDLTSANTEARATRRCNFDEDYATWDDPLITAVNRTRSSFENLQENIKNFTVTNTTAFYLAEVLTNLTETEDIEEEEIDIVAEVLTQVTEAGNSSDEVTMNVIKTVENVVGDGGNNISVNASANLLNAFNQQLENVGTSGKNFTFQTTNIVAKVEQVPVVEHIVLVFKLLFEDDQTKDPTEPLTRKPEVTYTTSPQKKVAEEIKVSIQLVEDVIRRISKKFGKGGFAPVTFAVHRTTSLFQEKERVNSTTRKVNSVIVSASPVGNVTISNLPDESNVKTKFRTISPKYCPRPTCVYWNVTNRKWANDGCEQVGGPLGEDVMCQCNHLTNFAVLVDYHGEYESRVLDMLSIIGCAMSITSLTITIVTYLSNKKLRTNRPKQIILNMSISLLGLYLFFVIGIHGTQLDVLCIIFGALTHFFLLASVTWMSIEAVNMYLLFVKVFNSTIHNFLLKACIIGWGFPALVVALCVPLSTESYVNCKYCFPDSETLVFKIGVFALVGVMLLCNLVIFIIVITKLTCGRKKVAKVDNKKKEYLRQLQNAIVIAIVLGMTWIFGFLSIAAIRDVTNTLFCIFNSLQGVCIFFFFGIRQKDVRTIWQSWGRQCWRKTTLGVDSLSTGLPTTTQGKSSVSGKVSTTAADSKMEMSEMKSVDEANEYEEVGDRVRGGTTRKDEKKIDTKTADNFYERVILESNNGQRKMPVSAVIEKGNEMDEAYNDTEVNAAAYQEVNIDLPARNVKKNVSFDTNGDYAHRITQDTALVNDSEKYSHRIGENRVHADDNNGEYSHRITQSDVPADDNGEYSRRITQNRSIDDRGEYYHRITYSDSASFRTFKNENTNGNNKSNDDENSGEEEKSNDLGKGNYQFLPFAPTTLVQDAPVRVTSAYVPSSASENKDGKDKDNVVDTKQALVKE